MTGSISILKACSNMAGILASADILLLDPAGEIAAVIIVSLDIIVSILCTD